MRVDMDHVKFYTGVHRLSDELSELYEVISAERLTIAILDALRAI